MKLLLFFVIPTVNYVYLKSNGPFNFHFIPPFSLNSGLKINISNFDEFINIVDSKGEISKFLGCQRHNHQIWTNYIASDKLSYLRSISQLTDGNISVRYFNLKKYISFLEGAAPTKF